MTVGVNPPKTPVTEGSNGVAAATVPNVCKMPGPPAPFVPTPLPNIGRSGMSPKGYSKGVTIEGNAIAIRGATFKSMGDVASQGTGGGIVSNNTEGPTTFVGPGSMDVKVEGKNVQLLGDPMLNNCGPSGSPANAATMTGVLQGPAGMAAVFGDEECPLCHKAHGDKGKLQETGKSKSAVSDVRTAIDQARAGAKEANGGTEVHLSAMMGAVECQCGKAYAGTSFVQYADVVRRYGHHAPAADPSHTLAHPPDKNSYSPDRFDAFQSKVGPQHKERFNEVWQELQQLSTDSFNGDTDEMAYPPGSCAAQLMLVLALDHSCRPVGLSERWYSSRGSKLKKLFVRDLGPDGKPMGRRLAEAHELKGDQPFPPCKTCQIILEALMCTEDGASLNCRHGAPAAKVCSKC